jgi:dTDP-4-dehydrorhamnose 3,5-epimerase
MTISKTNIEGVLIIEPRVFGDERGEFFESFNKKIFDDATDETYHFVQDNQSKSKKGVVRGLHFQNPPFAQGKLVRVISGAVLDVAVDIRRGSETYGEHVAVKLSEENNKQLWIPPGFAHGFVALEENTIFAYKCTNYYAPQSEGSILWNDKDLNINWGVDASLMSEKDEQGVEFRKFVTQFEN